MRHTFCILCVLCVMVTSAAAQNISRIEYFFNTDPGFGKATAITGFTPSANVADFPVSINLGSVSNGLNELYVRARDGNGRWSITNVLPFIKVDVVGFNIVKAEYFFNTDPGFGKATAITGFTPSADVVNFPVSINLSSVSKGLNYLFIRAKDSNGNWSITNATPFIKVDIVASDIVRAEYFFNTDPGFGKATAITGFTPSPDIVSYPVSINLSSVPEGLNNLYVSAEDKNGIWSITNATPFIKVQVTPSDIVKAEYFLNTDPGFGHATPVVLPVSANISAQAITINIEASLPGINTLYVRAKDRNGKWSLTNSLTFIKGTLEGDISSLEYFIDTDPGFGMGNLVELIPAQNISNYVFNADVSSVAENTTHNLFVRAKDADGVWSLTNIISFKKTTGVGINEFTDASAAFTAFPNPATEKITIECLPSEKMDIIELIDIHGELMNVASFGNNTEKQVDLSRLTNGVYFIKITSGNEVVYKKIVKK